MGMGFLFCTDERGQLNLTLKFDRFHLCPYNFIMRSKFFFVLVILFLGTSFMFAVELSGTYSRDYTVTTEFNTISKGKKLHVTNGASFTMTDAIVHGDIVVDEGCSFVAAKDGAGYLVFKPGTHVEGMDLYYKVRVSDDRVYTRKIPLTLDEIWKGKNQELVDLIGNMEFCYSSDLKGWVSINEIRFMNPFNEDLGEGYALESKKPLSEVLDSAPPPSYTEISGTYTKNFTVKTELNTVSKGKTLRIKKGVTFVMTDAVVSGSIIVDKGGNLVAAKDNAGYLAFKHGCSLVSGFDLYYKVRVSDELVFTRRIPMYSFNEILKGNNQELIDLVENMEFCYSSALKGWVTKNEIRFMNPFNENLYEDYDMTFTQSVSKVIENECRSLTVKNKSQLVVLPNKDVWGTKIYESINIESGSSLIGTDSNGHKLQLKNGVKVKGLPLYVRFGNDYIPADSILSDLWKLSVFSEKDFVTIFYKPELQAWAFEDIILGEDNITKPLKKKIEKIRAGR